MRWYGKALLFTGIFPLSFISCNNLISYSPYDADVKTQNINNINISSLQAVPFAVGDTLRFAVITDTHNNYDDLKDAISAINRMDGLSFVVCGGDITNWGTKDEFDWYWDKAKKANIPIITLMGNHDYLSNGKLVYKRMFGSSGFSFLYGGYKFVVFDDVVWENKNQVPDFEWLNVQLQGVERKILFAHIPPWSDQLEGKLGQKMDTILTDKNLVTAIYGHDHDYRAIFHDKIRQYVISDIDDRKFALVLLSGSKVELQMVDF